MPKIISLRDVYVDQLKDLYSAESQLIKALPKMAWSADSADLAQAFLDQFEHSQDQHTRLDDIFRGLGESPEGKKCKTVEGLIKKVSKAVESDVDSLAGDIVLIAAAQRMTQYKISGYETVKNYAGLLGEKSALSLFEQTLVEESETDEKLAELAGWINGLQEKVG